VIDKNWYILDEIIDVCNRFADFFIQWLLETLFKIYNPYLYNKDLLYLEFHGHRGIRYHLI